MGKPERPLIGNGSGNSGFGGGGGGGGGGGMVGVKGKREIEILKGKLLGGDWKEGVKEVFGDRGKNGFEPGLGLNFDRLMNPDTYAKGKKVGGKVTEVKRAIEEEEEEGFEDTVDPRLMGDGGFDDLGGRKEIYSEDEDFDGGRDGEPMGFEMEDVDAGDQNLPPPMGGTAGDGALMKNSSQASYGNEDADVSGMSEIEKEILAWRESHLPKSGVRGDFEAEDESLDSLNIDNEVVQFLKTQK
jgi:hypothetical protein